MRANALKPITRTRVVLVADSVRLTREALCEVLGRNGFTVAGSDARPASIVAALDDRFDVVVMNAATINLRAAVRAVESHRNIPIVAMSVAATVDAVSMCAELGLAGFVLADDTIENLLEMVSTATIAAPQCPSTAVPMLLRAMRNRAKASTGTDRLTRREREIAGLLREGLANKEIAARLGITARTVKNHLHHIYDKLGLHSRGEVAALLFNDQLLERTPAQ